MRQGLVVALGVCLFVGGCLNSTSLDSPNVSEADAPGCGTAVYGMTVSYSEQWLAYYGTGKAIHVQESPMRKPAGELLYRDSEVLRAAFHPRDAILFACYVNGHVVRWSRRDGVWNSRLLGLVNDQVSSCTVSPRGDLLAVGTVRGHVVVFTLGSRPQRLRTLNHPGSVWSIAFTPDGTEMTAAGSGTVFTHWNVGMWTATNAATGHDDVVSQIVYSADGVRLVSGGYDGTLRTIDRTTGRTLWRVNVGKHGVRSIGVSADGRFLAIGSIFSGEVQLRDAATGRLLNIVSAHRTTVTQIRFLADGTMLTSSHDGTIEAFANVVDSTSE